MEGGGRKWQKNPIPKYKEVKESDAKKRQWGSVLLKW